MQPEFHLTTRENVSPDLILGMLPANRAEWNETPMFLGWPAQFQRVHFTMTEASARLVNGLEALLDEPEGSAQELLGLTGMNHLGVELVDRISHHHAYEDETVLPRILALFPHLTTAVDLLENDHKVLENALGQSRQVFAMLRPNESKKSAIEIALEKATELNRILHRHTYDEEDLLIPPMLDKNAHL